MKPNDLAFPIRIDNGADEPTNHPGLTKLEYAAILLTQGMLAGPDSAGRLGGQSVVQVAVSMAEELFDELAKRENA
jgi:hypothetical protein